MAALHRWTIGVVLSLALMTHAATGLATARFVSLGGNDANPGTIGAPWRLVGSSVNRLVPGDTLYVRGGRYYEGTVNVQVSGTPTAPIVIRSYPGETATIDPTHPEYQKPGNTEWILSNPSIGEYVSRHSVSGDSYTVLAWVANIPGYENERLALMHYQAGANFGATTEEFNAAGFYAGPGIYEPYNHVNIRLGKTAEVRAAEQRYGRVFPEDTPNPADYSIIVTTSYNTLVVGGSYLVFRDLVLEPSGRTVYLYDNAHDLRLENMTVWIGTQGIYASGNVYNVVITRCRIFGDCPPWIFRSDAESSIPPAPAASFKATSILMYNGVHDWDISYNHIRGSAQHLIEIPEPTYTPAPGSVYNIAIHHNHMENAAGDALRLVGSADVGRVEVYENFISNCLHALSAGQGSPSFTGPLLFYRNVVSFLRDPAVNRVPNLLTWNKGLRYGYEYMFKLSGSSFTTQNTHIYHNTLVLLDSNGKGMNLMPQLPADTRCMNNLMVLVNGRVNGSYPRGAGQVVDGNLYWKMNTVDTERLMDSYDTVPALFTATGLEQHGIGATAKRGTDPLLVGLNLQIVDPSQTRWSVTAGSERRQPWDFAPGVSSPARSAAVPIPPHPVLGTLPDTRASRDLGALSTDILPSNYDWFPFDPRPNQDPVVDAGPDQVAAPPSGVLLRGRVNDDGRPRTGSLVSRWSMVSGPGLVKFEDAGALETRARFSAGGVYTLALVASDGEKVSGDSVHVATSAPFLSFETRVSASADDAQEGGPCTISLGGNLNLFTGKTVGLRFNGVAIPQGATILDAYVQFAASDGSSGASALSIQGEASDHAETFSASCANLSSRPRTTASVSWSPTTWDERYSSGPAQRTSDIAAVIQEIVGRPGWSNGSPLALLFTGTGARTAISYDTDPRVAALLHVDYVPPGMVAGVTGAQGAQLVASVAPNPIVRFGVLRFTAPTPGPARVEVFDVRGRRVSMLLDVPFLDAGAHELRIQDPLRPGVYFYRVRASGSVVTGRCLVLR